MRFTLEGLLALGHPNEVAEGRSTNSSAASSSSWSEDDRQSGRPEYRFAQTVVRQVAYATLSRRTRRARHLAAADHLGSLADPAHELAAVIATYLTDAVAARPDDPENADLIDRAVALLTTAARRALSVSAPSEARRLAEHGLVSPP